MNPQNLLAWSEAQTVEIVQIKTACSLPTVVCIHRLMCLSAEKVAQRLQHTPISPLPWHHARVVQLRVGVRRVTFGNLNLARWASAAVEADALATLEIFGLNTVAVLRQQTERASTEFVNSAAAIIHSGLRNKTVSFPEPNFDYGYQPTILIKGN